MAMSLNKHIICGNLGRDPEIRSMQNGNKVCNLSIATSESYKKKDGEKVERTEWHRVVIFNEGLINGVIEKYCHKGTNVYLEGEVQTRKWQDNNGNDRYSTETVLGFNSVFKLNGGKEDRGNGTPQGNDRPAYENEAIESEEELDDQIPF